jgi:GNAT superfamily N-acetyltransferase
MGWRMRPFAPVADRGWAEELWAAALSPAWPPLPAGIAMLRDGLVAEVGADPVGLVAVDMAGSIPLILVHPAHQRRGIGTGLLAAALDKLRAGGTTEVTAAASGGDDYIWPGELAHPARSGHRPQNLSNSPFRTPPRNARHSSGVNRRTGPSESLL